MSSAAQGRPANLSCLTTRPRWVLCFVGLMFVLPLIRGRAAIPSRALVQENPDRKEATVASEIELQRFLAGHDFKHRIVVDVREIALTANLRIDGTGWVSLVGKEKGVTTIRCATNSTGTALVIRRADVQLTGLRFVGCGNSAVVVEPVPLQSGEGQVVDFERVEFSRNGHAKHRTSGAAVNARRCPEQPCHHLSLRFRECQFVDNRGSDGGAIFAEDVDIDITQSTFEGNEATGAGGAIYLHNGKTAALIIRDSSFVKNRARESDEVRVTDNNGTGSIEEKQVPSGMGGAIFAHTPLSIDIQTSIFAKNTGCRGGGAMGVLHDATGAEEQSLPAFAVSDSTFQENVAYCGSQRDALDSAFFACDCSRGGALAYKASDEALVPWKFTNSSFASNRALTGAAMDLRGLGSSFAEHRIVSCRFEQNLAIRSGGALYLRESRVTIVGSRFSNNRAIYGGSIISFGPTFLKTERDPENPDDVTICENSLAFYGGAILSYEGGSLDLSALVVRNNTALGSGGGFSVGTSTMNVVFRDVIIENNAAVFGGGLEIVASPSITFESGAGQLAVIRDNKAAVGGGMHYLAARSTFVFLKVKGVRITGNKALLLNSPEMQRIIKERKDYAALPQEHVRLPDVDKELGHLSALRFMTETEEGNGGGFNLVLDDIAANDIVDIVFQDVLFENNEAVVGGGLAAHMRDLYWNKSNGTSCASILPGIAACQRFSFHNVTAVRNRAEYAGGVFCSIPNGIALSCGPENQTKLVASETKVAAWRGVIRAYCSDVHSNEALGRVNGEGADAGSKAVHLSVVGHSGPLKTVASGEKLAVPCEDERNASCASELRIAVKDVFGQTITRGIADANLTLALISGSITGGLRYTAVSGVAVIDSTYAWGIGIADTLTIVSEQDPKIRLDIPFSTRECLPGETTVGKECSKCPQKFYGFDPSLPCLPCESGAECGGGAAMVPKEGHWHSNPFSPTFRRCIKSTACAYTDRMLKLESFYDDPVRVQEAMRNLEGVSGGAGSTTDFPDYPQCSEGYRGFLCGSCASGYGHSYTGDCEKCPSKDSSAGLFFLCSVWLFAVIGINCAITVTSMRSTVERVKYERSATLRDKRRLFQRVGHIQRAEAVLPRRTCLSKANLEPVDDVVAGDPVLLAKNLVATGQLSEMLKILINYLQITSVALRVHVEWKSYLKMLLKAEAFLAGLSTSATSDDVECSFQESEIPASVAATWTRLSVPWIVLAALLLTCTIACLAMKIKSGFAKSSQSSTHVSLVRFTTYVVAISIVSTHFFFLDAVRELLRTVNCIRVEDLDLNGHPYAQYSTEAVNRLVWTVDTGVTCFQGAHLPLGVVGFAGLALAFLFVLLIVVWVPMNRRHADDPEFLARYWFVYQAYGEEWYRRSWESVILTRKALIAAVVSFSVHLSLGLQANMCAGVLTVAAILQALFLPFKTPETRQNVPDYANGLLRSMHLPKLGKAWVSFNNAVNLNLLEILSLASSISVFYSAIVSVDLVSGEPGSTAMFSFAFTLNALFLLYILYRMYAGVHVLLDLKLELINPAFLSTYDNRMTLFSLLTKVRVLVSQYMQSGDALASAKRDVDAPMVEESASV